MQRAFGVFIATGLTLAWTELIPIPIFYVLHLNAADNLYPLILSAGMDENGARATAFITPFVLVFAIVYFIILALSFMKPSGGGQDNRKNKRPP